MQRAKLAVAVAVCSSVFLLCASDVSAQAARRWVVVFNQQNSLPSRVDGRINDAGGTILARIPEIGVVAALSSDPDFESKMLRDPSVSEVAEDVEFAMIPSAERMQVQFADPQILAGGPAEPPGSDTQTGSEPFYAFQWDKKRMRASNQGSYQIGRAHV